MCTIAAVMHWCFELLTVHCTGHSNYFIYRRMPLTGHFSHCSIVNFIRLTYNVVSFRRLHSRLMNYYTRV